GAGPRLTPAAFQAIDKRSLLAADVRAVAAVEPDVERIILAERLGADVALGPRLLDCLGEHPVGTVIFASYVDPGLVGTDCVGRDQDPFDDHVRRVLEDVAVLRSARFR